MRVLGFLWMCSVVALTESALDLELIGPTRLPFAETLLSVLAIEAPENNIEITLFRLSDSKNVTISLAMTKYANENQISGAGVGDNVAIVSRDELNLTSQLISIFRKNNVLAVYRAGQFRPVLVYKASKNIDFAEFTSYYYMGPKGRDSIYKLNLDERGYGVALARPHGAAVKNELNLIRKEINKRLKLFNIFFQQTNIEQLSGRSIRNLNMLLNTALKQHLFLLDYYNVDLGPKYVAYRKTIMGEKRRQVTEKMAKLLKGIKTTQSGKE